MVKNSMQTSFFFLMHLGNCSFLKFGAFWVGKRRQVGTQSDQNPMPNTKSDFLINRALPTAGGRKLGFKGSKLGAKNDQKSFKHEAKMGRHLGIDVSSMLVDVGRQVGSEHRAKIDQKKQRKNIEKMNATKMPKKSQLAKHSINLIEISPMPRSTGTAPGRVGRGNS